jgi:hypothetical protein
MGMSGFKGRVVPDLVVCTDPDLKHLNICRKPWWTLFIREFTVWQCPKCSRYYRLEWHSAGADGGKFWTRMKAAA